MRKALKLATLMGLTAALVLPTASMADEMGMGEQEQTITIKGQLRERVESWNGLRGDSYKLLGNYRARIQIKAKLADGVTAVFTPQAVGYWGQNGNSLGLDNANQNDVYMHEAYMLLNNAFGVDGLIVKLGRQEVNLGNQRLVGSVGWSQAGRSLDGILVGYKAADYGLAAVFYGKLSDTATMDAWGRPSDDSSDIDLYVLTWQGNLKPFGFGGTYEVTDIYVVPDQGDNNINTLYGRVTPVVDAGFAKVKVNVEAAVQTGSANANQDYSGYFFSVGGGATFADVTAKPTVFVGYDYYSGDSDPGQGDVEAFWSVLPTAHKWLGHADVVWLNNIYQFNGATLQNEGPGVQDLYFKVSAKPLAKVAVSVDFHYFQTAEDYTTASGGKSSDVGWELDLAAKYKYSKNLCLTLGWEHFDPEDNFANAYPSDFVTTDAIDHLWLQADLKF